MNIFKSLVFHLPKNGAGADPKKSAPAPAQILNRLRLQPKNLGSDRLWLRNIASNFIVSQHRKILAKQVEFFSTKK